MFCNHCGAENPEYAKFCFACGQANTLPPVALESASAFSPEYSAFIVRLLLGVFLIAIAIFDLCQLAMQHASGARWARPLFLSIAGIALLSWCKRSWKTIILREVSVDQASKKNHRTLRYAFGIGLTVFLAAGCFGILIGKNRQELQVLNRDLGEYAKIGDRISTARNNVGRHIPDFVQMYESIERDVAQLGDVSSRLALELADYDADFPEFHAQTQKSLTNVSTTNRRMALLKKQIAVARKVAELDPVGQVAVWRTEMLPILEQEDKLDSAKTEP
jgi:zinc-ribbon domain